MPTFRPLAMSLAVAMLAISAPPSKGKAATKPVPKTLADEGFTPRALMYVRDLAGKQGVQLREASFTRVPPPPKAARDRIGYEFLDVPPSQWFEGGKEVNVYKVTSKGVLDGRVPVEATVPLVRALKAGPQMSLDHGQKWVDGERAGSQWKFAFDAVLYTFDQADEAFSPKETKAWGIERGPAVKWPHETYGQCTTDVPVFQSLVAAVQFGRNEIAGTLKFPGQGWVVPFHGVKWGDAWIAVSLEPRPFTGSLAIKPDPTTRTPGYFGAMRTAPIWMVLTSRSMLVGTSRGLDLAHMDRVLDSFTGAAEFDLTTAKDLVTLAEAYHDHAGKNTWLRSDEPDSFSRAADKAFVEAGLSLNLYPAIRNIAYCGQAAKVATDQVAQWAARIKSLGGSVVMTQVPAW